MRDLDESVPVNMAEDRLGVKPGSASLDELARLWSLEYPDTLVSVREWRLSPITHSGVWKNGKLTGFRPHLKPSTQR